MEQSSNDATMKDAQIKLRKEECALSMEQSTNDAAMSDAQIKSIEEECALSRYGAKSWSISRRIKDAAQI